MLGLSKPDRTPHHPVSCLTPMTSALLQQCTLLSCQQNVRPASLTDENMSKFWKDILCCGSILILWGNTVMLLPSWEHQMRVRCNYFSASVRELGVGFGWLSHQEDPDSNRNVSHLWTDSWKLDWCEQSCEVHAITGTWPVHTYQRTP